MVHILDLPVELLQLISDYPVDLTILRLVCKTFNAAFLDSFGREYLSELKCFVLDPRRLLRLKCITSQAHLVRKIRRVCLTFDVCEGKPLRHFPIVDGVDGTKRVGEFWSNLKAGARESYNNQSPNLAIFESILEDLRIARRASLEINFTDYSPVPDTPRLISLSNAGVAKMFSRVVGSGCPISSLKLRYMSFLDRELYGDQYGELLQASKSWEAIEIDVQGHDVKDMALVAMMQAANSLQVLTVCDDVPFTGSMDPQLSMCQAFNGALILANPYPSLRSVRFSFTAVDARMLHDALRSWSNTLEELYLCFVYLSGPGDNWSKVLRLLYSSYSKLERLSLQDLMEPSRSFPLPDGLIETRDVTLVGTGGHRKYGLEAKGREEIKEALRLNVESGPDQAAEPHFDER